ncbi:MAG TPA: hypothetical protein ENK74_05820, partial [Nitratifractor sp.]|nr:hypothetical protein [Nitratifractor sp.]
MKKLLLIPIIPFILYATTIKVATYNVDNLFDLTLNSTEYDDYKPNRHNWNNNTFSKKLEHITQVICDLNADVIALEEVENPNALKKLQSSLNRVGCSYPYSAITDKRGSAIQVAMLSKIALKKSRDIVVSNSKSDRNILDVTLKSEPKLHIFANHWRSKRAAESARLKYAKALLARLQKLPKGSEYIILGDFNSNYNECTNITAKSNDTGGVCGIDTILQTYYKKRLIKFRDKDLPKESLYHYNLWSEVDVRKRWSHDFYGKKSALDSIIISPSMVNGKGWEYKKGSFKVFKKAYLFQKRRKSNLNRWVYKNGKHMGKGYSDHLPLYAIFTTSNATELKHETFLDRVWKLFIPKVESGDNVLTKSEVNLEEFLKLKHLKSPVLLKDVCLLYKRGDIGVIKSTPNSRSVTLYKSAEGLEEGMCYDFKVYKKKRYYKLEEITDLDIVANKKTVDINDYIPTFSSTLMRSDLNNIGEIVKEIHGIYKDRYIRVGAKRYRLFVKQKRKGLL